MGLIQLYYWWLTCNGLSEVISHTKEIVPWQNVTSTGLKKYSWRIITRWCYFPDTGRVWKTSSKCWGAFKWCYFPSKMSEGQFARMSRIRLCRCLPGMVWRAALVSWTARLASWYSGRMDVPAPPPHHSALSLAFEPPENGQIEHIFEL